MSRLKKISSVSNVLSKYTDSELQMLKNCYENPNNEHNDLTFEEFVEAAEKEGVIDELISD